MTCVADTCPSPQIRLDDACQTEISTAKKKSWLPSINWPGFRKSARKIQKTNPVRVSADVGWAHDPVYLEMRRRW